MMIGLNLKRSLPFLIRESFILEEEESHQRTKTPSGVNMVRVRGRD